jgi:branched-chain amino acid aminotransferase
MASELKPLPAPDTLVFGQVRVCSVRCVDPRTDGAAMIQQKTDHMLVVNYDPVHGWGAPEIKPYGPLSLDPMSSCLQYCPNVFEGMKVRSLTVHEVSDAKFKPLTIRHTSVPRANLVSSVQKPTWSALRALSRVLRFPYVFPSSISYERANLNTLPFKGIRHRPTAHPPGAPHPNRVPLDPQPARIQPLHPPHRHRHPCLYVPTPTPTHPYSLPFSLSIALGVAASDAACIYAVVTPAGPYFRGTAKGLSLLGVSESVRAWPGGTGGHKLGLNYAPGFLPQRVAAKQGYDQILWLLGDEDRVTEVGAMNFFLAVQAGDGGACYLPALSLYAASGRSSQVALMHVQWWT